MVFGIFWLVAWIEYSSRFVVIVGAVTYYFNNHRDQEEEGAAEVSFGFKCAYYYHQGSIAFGAFIIALIRFIKAIFYYLAKKAEKQGGDNQALQCMIMCAKCLLECIERICDYMNEAAYCYVAVTGESFLMAAWHSFLLHLKHGLKFAFANMIAKVLIFIGKVGIVAANCTTLVMLVKRDPNTESVSLMGPLIVVAIVTFITASMFLALFEEAVMALLTCVCFDMDMNGGEPKFGPATFHDNYIKKMEETDAEMM